MGKMFILPLSYSQFIMWYNSGIIGTRSTDLFAVNVNDKNQLSQDDVLSGLVTKISPLYEEDFEVLFALVKTATATKFTINENNQLIPGIINISINNLISIIPISSRGRCLLKNRIDSNIRLESPLWEKEFLQFSKEKRREISLRGGEAMLSIVLDHFDRFYLSSNYKTMFEKDFTSQLCAAIELKHQHKEYSLLKSNLIASLFCYDRHDNFINTDLGYFFDFGKIINFSMKSKLQDKEYSRLKEVLKKYRNALVHFEKKSQPLNKIAEELSDVLNPITQYTEQIPPLSFIIFFKLRDEIRSNSKIDDQNISSWLQELFLESEKTVLLACWLSGAFFGFKFFAQQYYDVIKPPFYKSIINKKFPNEQLSLFDNYEKT